MTKDFKFTRYLYEIEEVKLALVFSLLNKKETESNFWAYELYYSGFKDELTEQLWNIYYDFYACLNPSFEKYLIKKFQEMENEKTLLDVISNLIFRPFNLDVFMLRQINNNFELNTDIDINNISVNLLKETFEKEQLNYENVINIIFNCIDLHVLLNKIIDYFNGFELKINKIKFLNIFKKRKNNVNSRIVLLSIVLHFYAKFKNQKIGKNIYVSSDEKDVILYKTIDVNSNTKEKKFVPLLASYKILELASLYEINTSKLLGLFCLKREKNNITEAYLNNWLFYASKAPLWKQRIEKYGGIINDENRKVIFTDDILEEEFYTNYGFEPDEQKKEIQNKSIQNIKNNITLKNLYETYKKNNLFIIEDKYLTECNKLIY